MNARMNALALGCTALGMLTGCTTQTTKPTHVALASMEQISVETETYDPLRLAAGDTLGMDGNGPVVLNVTAPWPSAPGLALSQQPLRLLVRHESDRKFVVEQSRNLKEWVVRWQLTGADEWRELLIPTTVTREYFRVRALD